MVLQISSDLRHVKYMLGTCYRHGKDMLETCKRYVFDMLYSWSSSIKVLWHINAVGIDKLWNIIILYNIQTYARGEDVIILCDMSVAWWSLE